MTDETPKLTKRVTRSITKTSKGSMIDELKVLDLLIKSYQHLRDYEAGDINDDELERRTDALMEDIRNLRNDPYTVLSEEDEQAYYDILNEYAKYKVNKRATL